MFLSSEAKQDIIDIRRYLKREAGPHIAKSVIEKIRDAFLFISRSPGAGHRRDNLTPSVVKFWAVFSDLIVYDATKRPIAIIRVLHGHRDVAAILHDN